MPHILEAQFPERAPSGAPGGNYQHIDTSPAMFGGQVAAATEKLGQGIERAGVTGLDVAIQQQTLLNKTHETELSSHFSDRASEKWAAFSSLEGRAAMDARPAFNADIEQLRNDVLEKAGSPAVKAALAANLRGQQSRYFSYAASHAARQERTYVKTATQLSAASAGNDASIAFSQDDIKAFESSLDKQDNEWRNYYDAWGFEPDAIEAEVAKRRGKTLVQIIKSTADAGGADSGPDVQRAAALYARYKDKMDAGSRLQVDGFLKPLLRNATAGLVVDFSMGRAPDPAQFRDAERAGGLPRGYVSRLFQVESGGDPDAVTGSNRGLAQFSPDLERRYGITDANRRDPIAQTRAVLAEAAEHRPAMAQALGREPRPSEYYLAHQQGLGGALAHLTNPDRPAFQSMLSTGEGRQKGEGWAKAAIWGNMTPAMKAQFPGGVETVTSGDFVRMWSQRFGGSDAGQPIPERSVALQRVMSMTGGDMDLQARAVNELNRRYSAQQQENVAQRATVDRRAHDTTAEALDRGTAKNPLTEAEFVGAYGAEDGAHRYADYAKTLQLGADAASLAALSPNDTAELINHYTPQPGEGYEAQDKRRDALVKAQQHLLKERNADPAAYAMRRLPAVAAANEALSRAISDQSAPAQVKTDAAARLAAITLSEQARIGVPADERRVVPKSYSDQLAARLSAPVGEGGWLAVVNQVEAEAKLWGDNWPEVYRDLPKSTQSLVRVIGSGVQPQAGRILAEVGGVDLPNILKDQDAERPAQVKKDVLNALKPFAATLTAIEGWTPTFNDFRAQTEKLAAYYVVKGDDSTTAAQKAVDGLLNFKYEYGPTYRVPKTAGDIDLIKDGMIAAKTALPSYSLRPAKAQAVSEAYRSAETVRSYQRDGVWITSPKEDGVMLAYKDEVVQTSDRKPLFLSWRELSEMGARRRTESRPLEQTNFDTLIMR